LVKIRKKSVLLSECSVGALAETALWILPKGWHCAVGAKANVPFAGWHKITRLFNFSFSGARESLRLFELKKMCGGENKKYRRVGNECRLTRCPFVVLFLCLWSPVKMVYFFCFSVRYFLSGRCLLRLHTTFSGFAFGRVSENKTVNTPQMLMRCRMFN
jgi:hypothetical protein